jgi:hypothetical protein
MQNRAKTGGILSIIAGILGFFWLLIFIGIAVVMLTMPDEFSGFYDAAAMPEGFFYIIAVVYIIMGIVYALIGVLAIVGGVFALKKKRWGWALAGAIGGTITFFP